MIKSSLYHSREIDPPTASMEVLDVQNPAPTAIQKASMHETTEQKLLSNSKVRSYKKNALSKNEKVHSSIGRMIRILKEVRQMQVSKRIKKKEIYGTRVCGLQIKQANYHNWLKEFQLGYQNEYKFTDHIKEQFKHLKNYNEGFPKKIRSKSDFNAFLQRDCVYESKHLLQTTHKEDTSESRENKKRHTVKKPKEGGARQRSHESHRTPLPSGLFTDVAQVQHTVGQDVFRSSHHNNNNNNINNNQQQSLLEIEMPFNLNHNAGESLAEGEMGRQPPELLGSFQSIVNRMLNLKDQNQEAREHSQQDIKFNSYQGSEQIIVSSNFSRSEVGQSKQDQEVQDHSLSQEKAPSFSQVESDPQRLQVKQKQQKTSEKQANNQKKRRITARNLLHHLDVSNVGSYDGNRTKGERSESYRKRQGSYEVSFSYTVPSYLQELGYGFNLTYLSLI